MQVRHNSNDIHGIDVKRVWTQFWLCFFFSPPLAILYTIVGYFVFSLASKRSQLVVTQRIYRDFLVRPDPLQIQIYTRRRRRRTNSFNSLLCISTTFRRLTFFLVRRCSDVCVCEYSRSSLAANMWFQFQYWGIFLCGFQFSRYEISLNSHVMCQCVCGKSVNNASTMGST